MKVYLLIGLVNYEGSEVLGVFSSEDLANDEKQEIIRIGRHHFDDFEVEQHTIDKST